MRLIEKGKSIYNNLTRDGEKPYTGRAWLVLEVIDGGHENFFTTLAEAEKAARKIRDENTWRLTRYEKKRADREYAFIGVYAVEIVDGEPLDDNGAAPVKSFKYYK